jgi:hypothetical protein
MDGFAPEIISALNYIDAVVFITVMATLFCAVIAVFDARELRVGTTSPEPFGETFIASFKRLWPFLMGYSIPIGLIAYVAGYMTSVSRAAAIGNLLPAALALIGGLYVYAFGAEAKHKALIGYCISFFAVVLIYGIQRGAFIREADREARIVALTRQELKIRTFRENLGLNPDPPAWILSTEPR